MTRIEELRAGMAEVEKRFALDKLAAAERQLKLITDSVIDLLERRDHAETSQ